MAKTLYKITFLNHGQVYVLYAKRVSSGNLWGFTEVADLVFDVHAGLVVDPTEERLRDEFGDTRVLHLPMQCIVRIEEVEKKGPSAIRDAANGENVVAAFPIPAKPR
jgi:hypothetical protein